jgi:hypothetical protein
LVALVPENRGGGGFSASSTVGASATLLRIGDGAAGSGTASYPGGDGGFGGGGGGGARNFNTLVTSAGGNGGNGLVTVQGLI